MSYNQLLNEHSLADTSTSEETNLSTTSVGSEKIDDLDTGDENLSGGGLLDELRGVGMDGKKLVRLDRATLVDGVTSDVHDTTESGRADGDGDGGTSVGGLGTSNETLGTVHGNSTNRVLAKMRSDLEDETATVEVLDLESVKDGREGFGVELNIDDGATDGLYRTNLPFCLSRIGACWQKKIMRYESMRLSKKNNQPVEVEGEEKRGTAGRCCCWEKRGRAARATAGAAVEKNAWVFFALSALRDMR